MSEEISARQGMVTRRFVELFGMPPAIGTVKSRLLPRVQLSRPERKMMLLPSGVQP